MLIFDKETDGFLATLTKIHCLIVKDTFSGEVTRYNDEPGTPAHRRITTGLQRLMDATLAGICIVPHNGIKFDIPAAQKLYPWFKPDARFLLDTLPLTRLIWPDLKAQDAKLIKRGQMPHSAKFRPHALETWGYRLKLLKSEYAGDPAKVDALIAQGMHEEAAKKRAYDERWDEWNLTMEDYCVQDVEVTEALLWRAFEQILKRGISAEAVEIEMQTSLILARQERYGFAFDEEAAHKLHTKLVGERLRLEDALRQQYGSFYVSKGQMTSPVTRRDKDKDEDGNLIILGYTTPLRGNPKPIYRTTDFTEGVSYTKVKLVEFNPGSRDHIANRLQTIYQWEPVEFTDDGKPKVDETVLSGLKFPGTENLKTYLMVEKRLGQLAEGKEAWLKKVINGRIHGTVNTNGAVTGRMTHSSPNVGQVPSVRAPYGKECRALFTVTQVTKGIRKILVGADAAGLELRCLAHYMARFDGGEYVAIVLRSDSDESKAAGTDMHSTNARALGLEPKQKYFDGETGRDIAKTWFYAFVYGAGDEKLGSIILHKKGQAAVQRGKKSRADFMRNLPALGQLVERVRAAVKARGVLVGVDGRILDVRSQHSALNTLLQSAGAVVMKKALIILDEELQSQGLVPGVHYEFVANVHDEWQIEANEDIGESIGKQAVAAIIAAGEHFKFRCPLGGAFGTGRNWAETH